MNIKNGFGWKIWKIQIFPVDERLDLQFMEHFRIGPITGKNLFSSKSLTIMLTDK